MVWVTADELAGGLLFDGVLLWGGFSLLHGEPPDYGTPTMARAHKGRVPSVHDDQARAFWQLVQLWGLLAAVDREAVCGERVGTSHAPP